MVYDEGALLDVFAEASTRTQAAHKKLAIKLQKIAITQQPEFFVKTFRDNLLRVLSIKKGVTPAEKLVSFFSFVLKSFGGGTTLIEGVDLGEIILRKLVHGFNAKDKTVRFRVLQLTGEIMKHMEEMNDDVYSLVSENVFQRTFDKELTVRSIAISCLAQLQGSGDDEENNMITKRLTDAMQNDPSADVRRSVVNNIDIDKRTTLVYILQRAKDIDATVRKSVYSRLSDEDPTLSFLDPKQLQKLFIDGLNDRDINVQKECLKSLCDEAIKNQNANSLLKSAELTDNKSAEMAITYYLTKSKAKLTFDEDVWKNINKFDAFFYRVYLQMCEKAKADNDLEDCIPPVTTLIESLRSMLNAMTEEDDDVQGASDNEFIFKQLLLITDIIDFSDEHGRRQMVGFLRQALVAMDFPEDILSICVPIVKKLSVNEGDFLRIMVDIFHDICEVSDDEDEETNDSESDLLLSCLKIAIHVLQNTSSKENPALEGIFQQFIAPSLKKPDNQLRGIALKCLGLMAFLDKKLAIKFMGVFVQLIQSNDHFLETAALEVLFDVIMFYRMGIFDEEQSTVESETVLNLLKTKIESSDEKIMTLALEGITKLFLVKTIDDIEIMKSLLTLYFSKGSNENQRMWQCLSYFFSVYPYSSVSNQNIISHVVVSFMKKASMSPDYQSIPILQIAQHLLDWTDVRRLVRLDNNEECPHVRVAEDLIDEIANFPRTSKIFFQMLGKVNFSKTVASEIKNDMAFKIEGLKTVVPDSASMTALKKFASSLPDIEELASQMETVALSS